ncbi:MAG: hypothetical protein LBI42_10425 [Chitinispirillales bacterium]|jgi:hypothetical protein|nr:hypothetical protein [Chitinispirillales bacterium]
MARKFEKYRVRVLCEDREHYNFIYGFLVDRGFAERKINMSRELPEGSQSGEQFVREHFNNEYKRYACGQENVLLVIMQDIDHDDKRPEDMKNKYSQLVNNGIKASDKLLFIFPKRNIETWFEWLLQTPPRAEVSESADFKQKHSCTKSTTVGKMASKFYSECHNDHSACDNAPSSLKYSCGEFERLCNYLKSI